MSTRLRLSLWTNKRDHGCEGERNSRRKQCPPHAAPSDGATIQYQVGDFSIAVNGSEHRCCLVLPCRLINRVPEDFRRSRSIQNHPPREQEVEHGNAEQSKDSYAMA